MSFFKQKTRERYGNSRTLCALNHSHRSKLESAVCQLIQLRQKAGEIELVQAECHVLLSRAKIKYIADFKCRDLGTGADLFIEAKGFANDRWPIIKKLWAAYGIGKLEVWGGSHTKPRLVETITPEPRQTHEDSLGEGKERGAGQ